jgi:hypothetical protein
MGIFDTYIIKYIFFSLEPGQSYRYSPPSFYEDSRYKISLIQTFITKLGSSCERELAYPKYCEQNRSLANEIANIDVHFCEKRKKECLFSSFIVYETYIC